MTAIDFGTVFDVAYSPLLLICGDCNAMLELISLTNDLDPAVGSLIWQIEYEPSITADSDSDGIPDNDWMWIEYDPETNPDLLGGVNRPLGTGYVGLYDHPEPGVEAWRNLRLEFTANPEADKTPFTFTITVTGTQV